MHEQSPIKHEANNEAELIAFFESRGYKNIELVPHRCRNNILLADKNGQKCFIKKFNHYENSDEPNNEKTNNEALCYKNLPKDILINIIEINVDDGYIVLENVDFDENIEDEKYIQEIADFQLNRLVNIDASFLPESSWEDYEKLFKKIISLEKEGIIDNAESIIQTFESKKDIIVNAAKIFSWRDFNLSNIRKLDGQIKIFDFEEIRQRDNAMVDMATMSIDLKKKPNLIQAYKEKIETSELYNEDLFNLMTIRRAVIVMYAKLKKIRSNQIDQFTQNNIDAFNEAINRLAA